MYSSSEEIGTLLVRLASGDATAGEQLFPLLYDRLHEIAVAQMRHERANHTLQPTALLHEAYLKILANTPGLPEIASETHFLSIAALAMRQILINHAKHRRAEKRGGGRAPLLLDDVVDEVSSRAIDILALDEALKRLEKMDPRQARIVELRFFGGMTVAQCARVLQISERTVHYEWQHARSWLRSQIEEPQS